MIIFCLILLSMFVLKTHSQIKSVTLTTSNTAQDGASISELATDTIDTSGGDWNCHCDDTDGLFLEISLDFENENT